MYYKDTTMHPQTQHLNRRKQHSANRTIKTARGCIGCARVVRAIFCEQQQQFSAQCTVKHSYNVEAFCVRYDMNSSVVVVVVCNIVGDPGA